MNGPAGTLRLSHRPPPPVISNSRLGMMLLVGSETILPVRLRDQRVHDFENVRGGLAADRVART